MVVEAAVFGSHEGLAHVPRHGSQRNVDAPHDDEVAKEFAVSVENPPALAGVEGSDLGGCRAPGEAAARQPTVEYAYSDSGSKHQAEP